MYCSSNAVYTAGPARRGDAPVDFDGEAAARASAAAARASAAARVGARQDGASRPLSGEARREALRAAGLWLVEAIGAARTAPLLSLCVADADFSGVRIVK